MPTFPIYRGKLPETLNPFNLRHYGLLTYWLFFRPLGLNRYLYDSAPDLHRQAGVRKFLGSFKVRAYCNLYLMAIASVLLSLALLGLTFGLYTFSTQQGHTASINAVVAVSDRTAISASAGDYRYATSLKVWDLERGALIESFDNHTKGINAVAALPGDKAISGGSDRQVNIWDLKRGTLLHSFQNHRRWVNDLAATPDGKLAISASADDTLIVWDVQQGKKLHTLKGHTGAVHTVVVTPDGDRAVSGSADGTVKVWNLQQGTLLQTLTGDAGGINAIALTPDGQQVVSASADGTVKIWNLTRGTLRHTLSAHPGGTNVLVVTPQGDRVVSGGADSTVKVWNLQQGTLLNEFTGHTGWVNAIAVTPDGRQAISASSDHTLKVWDIQQGKLLHTLVGHQEWVRSVAVTPDGQRAISGAGDRLPKVWNLTTGKEIPLTAVQRTLFLSTVAFIIALGLLLIWGTVTAAVAIAASYMAFGLAGSVVLALAIAVLTSFAFTSAFVWTDLFATNPSFQQTFGALSVNSQFVTVAFAIIFGTIWFVTFGIASRNALAVFGALALILAIGIGIGMFEANVLKDSEAFLKVRLVGGLKSGIRVGIYFNLLVAIGALRLLFYPLDAIGALTRHSRHRSHPVEWDELLVLPVPGSRNYLLRQLRSGETAGLRCIGDVGSNPFQRWVIQRTLHKYLHSTPTPLQFLYTLVGDPDLQAYVAAPVTAEDWQLIPERRQLLLGELGNQWVECSGDWANRVAERVIWVLTWVLRSHRHTPLTRFAAILYHFLDENTVNSPGFDLSAYKSSLLTLKDYPGGVELSESWAALSMFAAVGNLSELKAAAEVMQQKERALLYERQGDAWVPIAGAIQPQVLEAIARLSDIAAGFSVEKDSNSQLEQLAALARGTAAIEELETFIKTEIVTPERTILQRIIRQWQKLVAGETAAVAKKLR